MLIRRKFQIQAKRQEDIPSQKDLVNLIRVKRRTPEIKAAKRIYHLPVKEEVIIVAAVMRNQTQGSLSILNLTERYRFPKVTSCKNKMKIEKG